MTIDGNKKWISASYHPSGEYSLIYTIDGIRYATELSTGVKIGHLRTRKFVAILNAHSDLLANNFDVFYRTEVLTKSEYRALAAESKQILNEYFTSDDVSAGPTEYFKPV